ncbi:HNH endonuclease [Leptothoe spongobia]|uniref:HNH endonuclease n=1 Tax=Leptothoe spongobia TAU-MAC 1115 TaxID=1967444 RepID=A0A947GJ02_9CYAN|nr:HNH endonuclease [Leptothoe spongobia]MBT9315297.1 HNH endonuclease [Leptothoe spongobia TAU-MAC 1115]
MSSLSDGIRQQVRQRARNRCEYCLSHQDYTMGWLQIDHIQPVARGGMDELENLCLACELCNQYKWTQTEALDPDSGKIIPLFNTTWKVRSFDYLGQ